MDVCGGCFFCSGVCVCVCSGFFVGVVCVEVCVVVLRFAGLVFF